MSTNPTLPPVSNAAAQEAVKIGDLRGTVATLARSCDFAVLDLHAHNAGQPSRPTLLLIRPGDPFLFVYVMGDKGTLSAKQREWVEYVEQTGGEVLVIRPASIADAYDRFRLPR